jgi:signal transduction histidine kinase
VASLSFARKKTLHYASSINNLKNNATEIITSLRDTIWAFNKESITLTGISDRIKTYTQKIQPAYPQIPISVEENINKEKKLSPVQALHIFRIVQEALQNALRHSNSNKVIIQFFSNDQRTSISVEDIGKGFDPGKVQSSGNGLINMKTRRVESGYKILLEANIPTGTKVLIVGK